MDADNSISLLNMPDASMPTLEHEVSTRINKTGYVYVYDVPDSFDHVGFIALFGEFMPQYDGQLVWDIEPDPGMDDIYHSRNTRSLSQESMRYWRNPRWDVPR